MVLGADSLTAGFPSAESLFTSPPVPDVPPRDCPSPEYATYFGGVGGFLISPLLSSKAIPTA